ncbi:MAG TPA: carbamoyltransferase HypF [Polyangiaceae bacterium]|jgi:hydrogenase maturation protein HypF|nr:carbamoyltransferase HypF [Polyangiaceae bacterium]
MTFSSLEIRVRGRVQGVGFRPHVYRLARELGLNGEVLNDAEGVLIRASGSVDAMTAFVERISRECPPLARVETLETTALAGAFQGEFRIVESASGVARTEVAPDAVVCAACTSELLSPLERRFRYPFTNCTHCGPRLSIVRAIPYDRSTTTMAAFPLCAACDVEYRDAGNRRFHAEATACPLCGPTARLHRVDGALPASVLDDVDAARGLLEKGEIVAIKGLGGYHLACDATRADVVMRLRERKRRDAKPFALMARDLDVIRRYCVVSSDEERLLTSTEGPIVLLAMSGAASLPDVVAPGHRTLGFMLPTTPLHVLLLERLETPVVMTSGNVSDAPPVIDDDEARERLGPIADHVLSHDRLIANRIDDSVVRVLDGRPCVLRRARGYAPSPIRLPHGVEDAPPLLAYGGELKGTFCLLDRGNAVLSQHQGDLGDPDTFDDYRKNLELYAALFEHRPAALVADLHPDYPSSRLARERAVADGLPLLEVQHHHAHAAACLAENGRALDAAPVLAIVLDGLGLGDGGALWGGEFFLADYRTAMRLGTFKPVALLGGDQAAREPWRNLYAHLMAEMGWDEFTASFAELELHRRLSDKPRAVLDRMLAGETFAPRASSCGRLFDAVAAAVGVVFERQAYEGQAGALLEAAVDDVALRTEPDELAYPFSISRLDGEGLPYVDPLAMWRALFGDLVNGVQPGVVAARFHRGLARAVATMAVTLRDEETRFDTVALSGGCFQNRVLFEEATRRLRDAGFEVLGHGRVPPNDGGLALGQAVVAAARLKPE